MFRVNQTEWINPRLKGVEYVKIIPCQNNAEENCLYVEISTKDGDSYSSEYFGTFEDAENFVLELVEKFN